MRTTKLKKGRKTQRQLGTKDCVCAKQRFPLGKQLAPERPPKVVVETWALFATSC